LLLGAAQLRCAADVERVVHTGADFASAPATDMEVVHACREADLPFLPGIATITELDRLVKLGVSSVRVFPAVGLSGPEFVREAAALYPGVGFVPAGRLDAETVIEYLSIPAVLAVATTREARRRPRRAGGCA
jgi:2-dehydro-3-deoxyphosphogluconate aldolase/(4S)-4-hydroxy-2-oxoglutarate aldolase